MRRKHRSSYQAQLHNETHLIEYWYGVTWNINRRMLFKWKHTSDESYREAVQAFFEPREFLRTLREWVLFISKMARLEVCPPRASARRSRCGGRTCADPAKNRG